MRLLRLRSRRPGCRIAVLSDCFVLYSLPAGRFDLPRSNTRKVCRRIAAGLWQPRRFVNRDGFIRPCARGEKLRCGGKPKNYRDDYRPGYPRSRLLGPSRRASDDALDSRKQRSPVRSHRQLRPDAAQRLDFRKRPGISQGVTADFDRHIIAAMLAFLPNFSRDPPDRRMIKQKYLDRSL